MENVRFEREGNRLLIVIDLDHELGESKSGKSIIIASTGGNIEVPESEGVMIGLNVYRPVRVGRAGRRSGARW